MQALDRFLSRFNHGWLVLLTAIIFLLFMILVLPDQAERSSIYSEGIGSPDTSFTLRAGDLYKFAEAYGPDGRRQYILARWTFDLLFPFVYGAFFFSLMNYSLRRLWPERVEFSRLAMLAPAAILADLLENSALTALMALYPRQIPLLAFAALVISSAKWLLVGLSMSIGLVALFFLVLNHIWRRITP